MNNLKLQYFVDFLLLMGWMPASEGKNFKKYQPPQRLGLPADYFLELPKDGSKKGFHQYAQVIATEAHKYSILNCDFCDSCD